MEKLSAEGYSEFDDQRQSRLDAELSASDFYQFSEKPFENNPDPKFLYMTASYQKIFASILNWIKEGNGLAVITGEAGTGKTFFVHTLVSHLDEKVTSILVPIPVATLEDLLKAILLVLKHPTREESETALFRRFTRFLDQMMAQDKTLLIILDEAQGLNDRILDDIERFLDLRSS
jgi:type II secretory pathway predicted ATPase ExeA